MAGILREWSDVTRQMLERPDMAAASIYRSITVDLALVSRASQRLAGTAREAGHSDAEIAAQAAMAAQASSNAWISAAQAWVPDIQVMGGGSSPPWSLSGGQRSTRAYVDEFYRDGTAWVEPKRLVEAMVRARVPSASQAEWARPRPKQYVGLLERFTIG